MTAEMWLCRDYLPEIVEHNREMFPTIAHLGDALPKVRVETIPVPADCTDGFCIALWGRPEAHLDPGESGEWDRRYGALRTQTSLDVGLRLVTAQLR